MIRKIANKINHFFFTPIYVCSSRSYTFMASCICSITIFFRSFPSVFLKAISQQLSGKEQSFLFAFCRTIIVITLQHSGSLPLSKQVVVVLASGIIKAFNAALIALFKILFRPTTFLIKSFRIASFISFIITVWLIFRGIGSLNC